MANIHPEDAARYRLVRWFVGAGLLLLVGSFTLSALSLPGSSRADSPGSSAPSAVKSVAVAFVDVEGGVLPLYPTRPGRVVEVPFREGAEVKKGQVLLRVDDTLAKIERNEAALALEGAKERLAQAKVLKTQHEMKTRALQAAVAVEQAKQKQAEAAAEKARKFLADRAGGSPEDVRIAERAVDAAKAGVRARQAELEGLLAVDAGAAERLAAIDVRAKEKLLEKANYGVEECTVKAPGDGTVLRAMVNVGETLGTNPRGPALWFCPQGPRIVRAEVEQEFATNVAIGQTARIQDDATGGGEWIGKVTRVSDWYTHRRSILMEPMQFNDVRTLEVIIAVDPTTKSAPLRIGQRVRVTLNGK